ncbi:hypothetical protein [Mesorhizobium sp. 113-3-9]
MTRPVVYGGGKPMFRDLPEALHLEVLASTTYANGTTLHLYQPQ